MQFRLSLRNIALACLLVALMIAAAAQFRSADANPVTARPYNGLLGNVEPIQEGDGVVTDDGIKGTTGKTPAVKGEEPWLVSLIFKPAKEGGNGYFCAGTLIAPQWVLTAAHCLQRPIKPQLVEVGIGKFDLTSGEGEVIDAKAFYIHADYEDFIIINGDVALIELARPATAGAFLPQVTAATTQFAEPGDQARTVGWGLLRWLDSQTTDIPYGIDFPITTEAQCRAGYEGDGQINADNICAGLLKGQASACNGDSGSALIVKSDDGSASYQAGIVSAGATCGHISKYTIFTRVSFYNDWINRVVNGTFSESDTDIVTDVATIPNNFLGFNLLQLPFGFNFIDGFADDFEMVLVYENGDGGALYLTGINGDFADLDEVAGGDLEDVVPPEDITSVDGVQVVISDFDGYVEAVYVRNGFLVVLDGDVTVDQMRTLVSTVMKNSD